MKWCTHILLNCWYLRTYTPIGTWEREKENEQHIRIKRKHSTTHMSGNVPCVEVTTHSQYITLRLQFSTEIWTLFVRTDTHTHISSFLMRDCTSVSCVHFKVSVRIYRPCKTHIQQCLQSYISFPISLKFSQFYSLFSCAHCCTHMPLLDGPFCNCTLCVLYNNVSIEIRVFKVHTHTHTWTNKHYTHILLCVL